MNNIFLNQDPILGQYQQPAQQQYIYPPQLPPMPPMKPAEKNWIDELDNTLKSLSPEVVEYLGKDEKWNELNTRLSGTIHEEIMNIVKNRLLNNPDVIANAKEQLNLIRDAENKLKEEERKNISELNDYMKNYSHLTFDEYRKIKNGGNEN